MILLAAVACNKEVIDNTPAVSLAEGETLVRLTGRITPPTKVEFDDTYGHFSWTSVGDAIAIHAGDGKNANDLVMVPKGYKKATVVPKDGDPSRCDFFFVMSEKQRRDMYAVYPLSIVDEANYGDPDLVVNLPVSYDIASTGMANYCPTPMVAVNDPAVNELDFRHVGGLLRLKLNDVSPATASIEVSLGKRLTGSFLVNDPDTAVPYIITDDAADVVTFNLSEPIMDYVDNFILNVPVPTGTYDGLTVTAKNSDGDIVYSYEDAKRRMFDCGRGRHAETSISTVTIPLTLEAIDDGAIGITNQKGLTIEYSYDNENWTESSAATIILPAEAGQCVYLRGNNECYGAIDALAGGQVTNISTQGQFYIYGNIMSLIDAEHFEDRRDLREIATFSFLFFNAGDLLNHPEKSLELPATTLAGACYFAMFAGCSSLSVVPALPATTLVPSCYTAMFYSCVNIENAIAIYADVIPEDACSQMYAGCSKLKYVPDLTASNVEASGYYEMFSNCTSLQNPPKILATTIAEKCYYGMFEGCTSLVSAPELPVLEMPERGYCQMFRNCTSLTTAPMLPATSLAESCYSQMFYGCSALTKAPDILPSLTLAKSCYYEMFRQCTSLQEAPVLPATTLEKNCYWYMFNGCSQLNHIKALFLTNPYYDSGESWTPSYYPYTYGWLDGVSSSGVFEKNSEATWTSRGANSAPEDWEIVSVTE